MQNLCRMLCAFSKFHLPFPPVLSGRLCWRRSRSATVFSCSGSSASGTLKWLVAMFQSMHLMKTSTTLLLGSTKCCKPLLGEPALALLIAVFMSLTWVYISVSQYITVYASIFEYTIVCTRLYKYIQGYFSIYQYVLGCTSIYKNISVCTSIYLFIQ
jgi:hypothetical protein